MTAAKNSASVSGQSKAGEVREIEIDRLFVSPDEARKTIDQEALRGLAASIGLHGIQEPLLVRPRPGVNARGNDGGLEAFEIVAGQRRCLAARIAGKTSCPCIVRAMPDAEAAEVRTISNLQREDMPPLEEALAFQGLLAAPGATVDTVAAKLGKASSYIGRRLQLLKAIAPVREALTAGAIEVGHAMELARLDEKQQKRLLDQMDVGYENEITPDDIDDDEAESSVCRFCGCTPEDACQLVNPDDPEGDPVSCKWANEAQTVCTNWECLDEFKEQTGQDAGESEWTPTGISVAALRRQIERTTLRVLSDAPFPLEDELPPMACTECPKRSGNAQLLFDDCAQDTCTDRECYDAKVEGWIRYEVERAHEQKRKLLMLGRDYRSDKAVIAYYSVTVIDGERYKLCGNSEEAIWIDGEKAGHRVTICREAACKVHKSANGSLGSSRDPVEAKVERKEVLAKVSAEKAYRSALFKAIAAAKVAAPTPAMLVALVDYAISRSDGTLKPKAAALLGWDKGDLRPLRQSGQKAVAGTPGRSACRRGGARRAALLGIVGTDGARICDAREGGGPAGAGEDVWRGREGGPRIDGSAGREGRAGEESCAEGKACPKKPAKAAPKKAPKKPAKTAVKKGGRK